MLFVRWLVPGARVDAIVDRTGHQLAPFLTVIVVPFAPRTLVTNSVERCAAQLLVRNSLKMFRAQHGQRFSIVAPVQSGYCLGFRGAFKQRIRGFQTPAGTARPFLQHVFNCKHAQVTTFIQQEERNISCLAVWRRDSQVHRTQLSVRSVEHDSRFFVQVGHSITAEARLRIGIIHISGQRVQTIKRVRMNKMNVCSGERNALANVPALLALWMRVRFFEMT